MEWKELRLIVTGHNEAGQSIVVFEGPPSNAHERNGAGIAQIWATDSSPVDNQNGEDAALRKIRLALPPMGSLFWLCKVAPAGQVSAADSQCNAAKALDSAPVKQSGPRAGVPTCTPPGRLTMQSSCPARSL